MWAAPRPPRARRPVGAAEVGTAETRAYRHRGRRHRRPHERGPCRRRHPAPRRRHGHPLDRKPRRPGGNARPGGGADLSSHRHGQAPPLLGPPEHQRSPPERPGRLPAVLVAAAPSPSRPSLCHGRLRVGASIARRPRARHSRRRSRANLGSGTRQSADRSLGRAHRRVLPGPRRRLPARASGADGQSPETDPSRRELRGRLRAVRLRSRLAPRLRHGGRPGLASDQPSGRRGSPPALALLPDPPSVRRQSGDRRSSLAPGQGTRSSAGAQAALRREALGGRGAS